MKVFAENLDKIDMLNAKMFEKGTRFGINKFADMRSDEFKHTYTSSISAPKANVWSKDPSLPVAPLYSKERVAAVPAAFDWRTRGAVTPVKNQGL